ncbi:MAG: hypothetical protein K6G65_02510 [Lachnospiraceae bacterium]|nr:hypothetical protein [Lachnospiraceae bacterium]
MENVIEAMHECFAIILFCTAVFLLLTYEKSYQNARREVKANLFWDGVLFGTEQADIYGTEFDEGNKE